MYLFTGHQEDIERGSDSTDDEEADILMAVDDLAINFSDLKEFEATKKPRRRKKKTDQSQNSTIMEDFEDMDSAQTNLSMFVLFRRAICRLIEL